MASFPDRQGSVNWERDTSLSKSKRRIANRALAVGEGHDFLPV
jgi:hypothetical protein